MQIYKKYGKFGTSHLFSQLVDCLVVSHDNSALFVPMQYNKCRGWVLDGLVVKWL